MLLPAYGWRGDVAPVVELAVRLGAPGAGVWPRARPGKEFAARLAGAGVPLVPAGAWR